MECHIIDNFKRSKVPPHSIAYNIETPEGHVRLPRSSHALAPLRKGINSRIQDEKIRRSRHTQDSVKVCVSSMGTPLRRGTLIDKTEVCAEGEWCPPWALH
jgi:hypothetical protein